LETVEVKPMSKTATCPVAATLELIGGKYKALILWHLSDGTLRFNELNKRICKATPKMLTQQLRELESQKLVSRKVYPIIPPRVEYTLTELGRSLLPILVAMRDWGADYLKEKNLESNCFMMHSDPITQTN
jgi:DNA-binding HxlR family transcriptional regulator